MRSTAPHLSRKLEGWIYSDLYRKMIYAALIGLCSADALHIYMNKIKIPDSVDGFLSLEKKDQVAVGGFAGEGC